VEFLAALEPAGRSEGPAAGELPRAEALSPEKRALLLKRLRAKATQAEPDPS
jgi:hypothetical protein